jgi:hypothetical protein
MTWAMPLISMVILMLPVVELGGPAAEDGPHAQRNGHRLRPSLSLTPPIAAVHAI